MNQISIELFRSILELYQIQLDPNESKDNHKHFLLGFIECAAEFEVISQEERDELYADYY